MTYHHIKGKTIQTDKITADEAREELRIRQLFYSQYYKQNVFSWDGQHGTPEILRGSSIDCIEVYHNGFLLLRDVSNLTDEEAYTVAKLAYTPLYDHPMDDKIIRMGKNVLQLPHLSEKTATYLKLVGALTRFTYLDKTNQPVTIPASDILLLEWAKIKEKI